MTEENKNGPAQKEIAVKYQTPSRFDTAPYGQIWKVIGEKDESTIWVQVSRIEGDSNWVNITALFNKEVQALLRNQDFQELLQEL